MRIVRAHPLVSARPCRPRGCPEAGFDPRVRGGRCADHAVAHAVPTSPCPCKRAHFRRRLGRSLFAVPCRQAACEFAMLSRQGALLRLPHFWMFLVTAIFRDPMNSSSLVIVVSSSSISSSEVDRLKILRTPEGAPKARPLCRPSRAQLLPRPFVANSRVHHCF